MSIEEQVKVYVSKLFELCEPLGLVPNEDGLIFVQSFFEAAKPSEMAFAVIAANDCSFHFQEENMISLVRSSETALMALQVLKKKYEEKKICDEEWTIAKQMLSPYLKPNDKTDEASQFAINHFGNKRLSDYLRPETYKETETRKILETGFDEYKKSHNQQQTKSKNWWSRFFPE
ncbi:MAG: hypothetical protein ABJI96_17390 [Paracoccaceae bacterium]